MNHRWLLPLLLTALLPAQRTQLTNVPLPGGATLRCAIALPAGHDAARAWPTVFALPGANVDERAIDRAANGRLQGLTANGWMVVIPLLGDRLDNLPALCAWLRTRHRIERGGMHLLGCDGGGDLAFAAMVDQPFEFASLTVLGTGAPAASAPVARLRGKRIRLHVGDADRQSASASEATAATLNKAGIDAGCAIVPGDTGCPDLERDALRQSLASLHATTALNGTAAAVSDVLDAFHDAAARADEDSYFAIFPDDGVFLGTDATERWPGSEFKAFAMPWFQKDSAWIYVPQRRHVTVAADGAFAWFDEALGSAAYGECRGTGVLQRRGERWCILQYDLTIPVPNDIAGNVVAQIRAFTDGLPEVATTVIVVRHAEKADDGDDPELSPAGRERAERLARMLQDLPIRAVFHSQYRRTAATVEPLCTALHVPAHAIAAAATKELAQKIRQQHRGQTVVVVGHSNTVPAILKDLGVREPVTMTEKDYDRLFVVTIQGKNARLLPLRHGTPVPAPR
ncbi:MAG: nuclear transport factor 2 family protein [Planctomycetes bacterium]|nr:nuclear transport factor 2 family protein [Planctomycetota bacterium]